MTINEKIVDIKKRLILTEAHYAELIEEPVSIISKWEKETISPTKEQIKKIADVFHIDSVILFDEKKDLPLLSIKKKVNSKKYNNQLSFYSEILKEYFPAPCHIYVLAKNRQKGKIMSILDIFFNNSKQAFVNEMENFSPSYLIEKNNKSVLVNINTEYLEIYELNIDLEDKRFIFGKYKYVKANEIKLK